MSSSDGTKTLLGETEVGVISQDGWTASADLHEMHAWKLLFRRSGHQSAFNVGDLAPAAVAINHDVAYVSGVFYETFRDPGVATFNLATGKVATLLPAASDLGSRTLVVSSDASLLATSLCDERETTPTCSLELISINDGAVVQIDHELGVVPIGVTSSTIVVTPLSAEPVTWIAGLDAKTGRESWRVADVGEIDDWLDVGDGRLVFSHITSNADGPTLTVESLDVGTGERTTLYSESRDELARFWPELSDGDRIVVASGRAVRDALAAGGDGVIAAIVLDQDGRTVAQQLALWRDR